MTHPLEPYKHLKFVDLHIFEYYGRFYAFDPVAVRVIPLDPDEYLFLKACQKDEAHDVNSISGWKLQETLKTICKLSRKNIFSSRCSAESHPLISKVEIIVNVTQECNLVCRYCFVGQGKFGYGKKRELSMSPYHAKRLVEVLPEALPWAREFCIHFYGGEPLLNLSAIRAAVDAASLMHDTRFSFAITTNGTICSEEAISILCKGRFDVILSIDGPPRIHDALRRTASGKPTHVRVLRFLNQLKVEKLFVRGSSVVRRGWSLREACEYLKSLPVDAIKAQAVRLPKGSELALNETEYQQYFNHLKDIAGDVIDCVRRSEYPKDDRYTHRVLQLLRGTRRIAFCGAGRWIFGLAADGTVLPCALLAGHEGMSLGHIDEPARKWVERGLLWAEKHGPRSECQRCWALPLCGGGCPAMLSVCGEDECRIVRANCEMAIAIYGAFFDRPSDLLVLAGVP